MNLQVRGRVSLLCMDEAREEQGVLDEEDRRVVANQVPDTLLCVELDRETARIPVNKIKQRITDWKGTIVASVCADSAWMRMLCPKAINDPFSTSEHSRSNCAAAKQQIESANTKATRHRNCAIA